MNRKKNGEFFCVEESISPIREPSRQHHSFHLQRWRDLTDRVRLEAQLLQAQKMDAIGRLAGGVAHDFNNLLTIITGFAELALDEVGDTPVGSKIGEILLAARRAAELAHQRLAFRRKQPRALRVADLNQVIRDIAKTLPRLIAEDIEFTFAPCQE